MAILQKWSIQYLDMAIVSTLFRLCRLSFFLGFVLSCLSVPLESYYQIPVSKGKKMFFCVMITCHFIKNSTEIVLSEHLSMSYSFHASSVVSCLEGKVLWLTSLDYRVISHDFDRWLFWL